MDHIIALFLHGIPHNFNYVFFSSAYLMFLFFETKPMEEGMAHVLFIYVSVALAQ